MSTASPLYPQTVVFGAPKQGYSAAEWEDGGGYTQHSSGLRFAVADGATEGFESRRWVRLLLDTFLALGARPGPALDPQSLVKWVAGLQDEWARTIPATKDYFDLQKIKQGSAATFVGVQLDGLDGGSPPRWQGFCVGDSVLFQVRRGRLVKQLPAMSAAEFGTVPDLLSTRPDMLEGMTKRIRFDHGDLQAGDVLFAASDALAKWMLTWAEKDQAAIWRPLSVLARQADFDRLIDTERRRQPAALKLKDDDVTLLRVRLHPRPAQKLVMPR